MLLWDFLGTPVRVCWFIAVLITVGCTFDLAPLEEAKPDAAAGGSGGSGGPTQDGGVPLGGSAGAGAGGTAGAVSGGSGGGGFGGTAGTGAGGTGATGAGGTGATGAGGSGTGGTGVSGGAGGFACANIAQLPFSCDEPSQTFCECQSCYGVCEDPKDGYPLSDCVCPSCWGFVACDFCDKNGRCDPLGEGCGCIDCAGHPNCVGY